MLELEWDEVKRRANLRKHGLDFADAARLDWDQAAVVADDRFPYPEPRFWAFVFGQGRLYFVAFCRRGPKLRMISFRKANKKEVRRYGQATGQTGSS
jgi:uncharacterized DUF497 family protein